MLFTRDHFDLKLKISRVKNRYWFFLLILRLMILRFKKNLLKGPKLDFSRHGVCRELTITRINTSSLIQKKRFQFRVGINSVPISLYHLLLNLRDEGANPNTPKTLLSHSWGRFLAHISQIKLKVLKGYPFIALSQRFDLSKIRGWETNGVFKNDSAD